MEHDTPMNAGAGTESGTADMAALQVRQPDNMHSPLSEVFERAPAFMCVLRGQERVFESANQRFVALVGARELIGRPLLTALPELAGQRLVELLDSVQRDGQPVDGSNERLMLRRGGALEERFIDVVCVALPAAGAEPGGVLMHGVDVTERMRSGMLAVGQRNALALAVSGALLDDVLDVLAHTAEEHAGGVGLAGVQLIEGGEDGSPLRLRHAAGPSLPASFMAALDAMPVGLDGGAAGAAAFSGDSVSVHDIAAGVAADNGNGTTVGCGHDTSTADGAHETDTAGCDQDTSTADGGHETGTADGFRGAGWNGWRALCLAHGVQACCCIPILSPAGAVLGVFSWYRRASRAALENDHPRELEHAALALLANTASLVIGQRHEAQERKAAEDRSRNILESISDGFLAIDARWEISYANRAAEHLVRRERAELIGMSFWEVFPGTVDGEIDVALRHAAQAREAVKLEVLYRPTARWVELNICPTADGGIALYFRDRSKRRRAEEGIRRLAAVAEQSTDFIAITGADARGIFLNRAGRSMSGIAADADIAEFGMLDFFAPPQRQFVREVILPALNGEAASWEGEMAFFNRVSGASIPVYFKGFAVRDDRGRIIGLATVTRDISVHKQAEDALRRVAADLAESDNRKSAFLATLAHELRNPLAPIRTGLDLIGRAPDDAAIRARVHAMMERQLGQLIHLVDDLLDVARITSGKIELKREPVALAALVTMAVETCGGLIEAGALQLELALPDTPLVLEVDATRMVQVLSNLLNNAAKYTPAGGWIRLSAWREDAEVVIAVADSGIGIPPDALVEVFNMFTQVERHLERSQGGLGIGLSLVRRLVELHGGRVQAASPGVGLGSTFTLRLPLRQPADGVGQADGGSRFGPNDEQNGAPNGEPKLEPKEGPKFGPNAGPEAPSNKGRRA